MFDHGDNEDQHVRDSDHRSDADPGRSEAQSLCPTHVQSAPIHGPAAIHAVDSDGELAVTWDDVGLTVWDVRDPVDAPITGVL